MHESGLSGFSTLSPIPGFVPWLRLSSASKNSIFERKGPGITNHSFTYLFYDLVSCITEWLAALLVEKMRIVDQELGLSSAQPHDKLMVLCNLEIHYY